MRLLSYLVICTALLQATLQAPMPQRGLWIWTTRLRGTDEVLVTQGGGGCAINLQINTCRALPAFIVDEGRPKTVLHLPESTIRFCLYKEKPDAFTFLP